MNYHVYQTHLMKDNEWVKSVRYYAVKKNMSNDLDLKYIPGVRTAPTYLGEKWITSFPVNKTYHEAPQNPLIYNEGTTKVKILGPKIIGKIDISKVKKSTRPVKSNRAPGKVEVIPESEWKEVPDLSAWDNVVRKFDWSLPMSVIEFRYPVASIIFPIGKDNCAYCETRFYKNYRIEANDEMRTIDHIFPISKGGDRHRMNTTNVCYKCNQNKGNLLLGEFAIASNNPVIKKNCKWFYDNYELVKNRFFQFLKREPDNMPTMKEFLNKYQEFNLTKFDIAPPKNNIDAEFINFHEE